MSALFYPRKNKQFMTGTVSRFYFINFFLNTEFEFELKEQSTFVQYFFVIYFA